MMWPPPVRWLRDQTHNLRCSISIGYFQGRSIQSPQKCAKYATFFAVTTQSLKETGRFAPSTTGPAHPGTLLAALLCWLDARSRGARIVLRLEDLDPDRCRPEYASRMQEDLQWVGLDFDQVTLQSDSKERHEHALDTLSARGLLYPCSCTRRSTLR